MGTRLVIRRADFSENAINYRTPINVSPTIYQSGGIIRQYLPSTGADGQIGDDVTELLTSTQYTSKYDIFKADISYPNDIYQIQLNMSYNANSSTTTYIVAAVCDSNNKILGVINAKNNDTAVYLRQTYKINMKDYNNPAFIYFCNGLKDLQTKGDTPVVTALVENANS